jgi:murein DD-endopeptidase MepM/ murein hydrolase activator NlpD
MKLNKYTKLKRFFILIVPENAGIDSRTRKIGFNKFIWLVFLYTLTVMVTWLLVLNITPLGYYLNLSGTGLSKEERREILNINEKMIYLTKELQELKNVNKRLKNAINLGDSSVFGTEKKKNEESTKVNKKLGQGNLLWIIKKIFFTIRGNQNKDIYFIKPLDGFISRDFNPEKGHMGIDVVARTGTPVYAAANGYVVFSDYTIDDGYSLIINHSNDYITVYKHCSSLLKRQRESVLQGELIALSGNTGEKTSGPHLHFEVWKNGKPINPKTVLINY